ncbi:hypothetical protein SDC9_55096 [bioreactor metagenome]|uniref:Uncharacterized protein n=1 Tax=bioreactor metagenome TaxID=1076179 RepID=A0A644WXZ7_9ZZZZ
MIDFLLYLLCCILELRSGILYILDDCLHPLLDEVEAMIFLVLCTKQINDHQGNQKQDYREQKFKTHTAPPKNQSTREANSFQELTTRSASS